MSNKKAQTAILDMTFATIILIFLIIVSFVIWNKYSLRLEDTTRYNEMELVTLQIADQLIKTPGVPDNWEYKSTPGIYASDSNTKGLWHTDEGTGLTTSDISGNGNTGSLLGINGPPPLWIDSQYQKALNFAGGVSTGKYQYVKVPVTSGSSLDIKGPLTLEAWIKPKTTSSTQSIIARQYNFELWSNSNKINFGVYDLTGGLLTIQSTSTVQTNIWTHIAATYDHQKGLLSLYINGKLDSTSNKKVTNFVPNNNQDLRFGNGYVAGNFASQFNGDIDEIRISNITRTEFGSGDAVSLGLAEKDRVISPAKLNALLKIGYNGTKTLLNIDRYDYYLLLKKQNQSIAEIGTISSTKTVKIIRNVIYENEPSTVEIALYE